MVRLLRGWLAGFALVCGAPAFATSFEDCERVLAQFQGQVARVAVAGDHPNDKRAGLRTSIRAAVKAGEQSDVRDALDQLALFEKQATAMEGRGELSRFDAERMVKGAQAAALCFEAARDGR